MGDLKLVFVAVAATLVMCQMVSARPDVASTGEEGLSLKNVEASVSIAVDDVRKNMQDLASKAEKVLTDLRNAAKSPETQNMLNTWNDHLAKLATNVKDAAKEITDTIQSNMPTAAPAAPTAS